MGSFFEKGSIRGERAAALTTLEKARSTALRRRRQLDRVKSIIEREPTPFKERTALLRDTFEIEFGKHGLLIDEHMQLARELEGKLSSTRRTAALDEAVAKLDIEAAKSAATAWNEAAQRLENLFAALAKEANKLWQIDEITASVARAVDSRAMVLQIGLEIEKVAEQIVKKIEDESETLAADPAFEGRAEVIRRNLAEMRERSRRYAEDCRGDITMEEFRKRWGVAGSDLFGNKVFIIAGSVEFLVKGLPVDSELRAELSALSARCLKLCEGQQKIGDGKLGEALSFVFPNFLKYI
jgi:hypothetical protein